jgi:hypothetical protein
MLFIRGSASDMMKQATAIPAQLSASQWNILTPEFLYLCFRVREFCRIVPVHQETDEETAHCADK